MATHPFTVAVHARRIEEVRRVNYQVNVAEQIAAQVTAERRRNPPVKPPCIIAVQDLGWQQPMFDSISGIRLLHYHPSFHSRRELHQ